MKGSFKANLQDFRGVSLMLRNIADRVPDHAARTMREAAGRIKKTAQNWAPEDTGDLVNAIEVSERRGARSRLEMEVSVGAVEGVVGEGGRVVSNYAELIHERYEDVVRQPGPKTLEKMAIYGADRVGSGFLTRAAEEESRRFQQRMIQAIKQVIDEES